MQYAMSLQLRFMLTCLVCAAVLSVVQGKVFAIGLLQDLRLDTCSVNVYMIDNGCMSMQPLTACTRSIDERMKKAKTIFFAVAHGAYFRTCTTLLRRLYFTTFILFCTARSSRLTEQPLW